MTMATRADHVHGRLTSATTQSTAANGEATVMFTRSFGQQPSIDLTPIENGDNGGLVGKVRSFVQDGSLNYTGCVVKFYRIQPLPSVLVLLSALLNFRVDAGTVGVLPFSCIALAAS